MKKIDLKEQKKSSISKRSDDIRFILVTHGAVFQKVVEWLLVFSCEERVNLRAKKKNKTARTLQLVIAELIDVITFNTCGMLVGQYS